MVTCKECNTDLVDDNTLKYGVFSYTCDQCLTSHKIVKNMYGIDVKITHVTLGSMSDAKIVSKPRVWSEDDNGTISRKRDMVREVTSVCCVLCNIPVQMTLAVFGRVVTNFVRNVIDRLVTRPDGRVIEEREVMTFPAFKTGFVCNTCFDQYNSQTYVKDGEVRPMLITLPWPKDTVMMSRSQDIMTRDDNYPQGKPERPKAYREYTDVDGEVIRLKVDLPITKYRRSEVVDPAAYAYFMKPKGVVRKPEET